METINIKGKEYVMVNERLKYFRENYKDYSLVSEIIKLDENSCIIKAIILDKEGRVVATGHAQEDKSSSTINKTSFVENCETSAWGRALGNFGIGIDTSVASAEEVSMAIAKQEREQPVLLGGKYIFYSGQYQGKAIEDVYDEDKQYIERLLSSDKVSKNIKDNIEVFLSGVSDAR